MHFGSQDFVLCCRQDFPNDSFWRISTEFSSGLENKMQKIIVISEIRSLAKVVKKRCGFRMQLFSAVIMNAIESLLHIYPIKKTQPNFHLWNGKLTEKHYESLEWVTENRHPNQDTIQNEALNGWS